MKAEEATKTTEAGKEDPAQKELEAKKREVIEITVYIPTPRD